MVIIWVFDRFVNEEGFVNFYGKCQKHGHGENSTFHCKKVKYPIIQNKKIKETYTLLHVVREQSHPLPTFHSHHKNKLPPLNGTYIFYYLH